MVVTVQETFSQAVENELTGTTGTDKVKYLWVYWIADLLAGALAAVFYNFEERKAPKADDEKGFLE